MQIVAVVVTIAAMGFTGWFVLQLVYLALYWQPKSQKRGSKRV